MYYIAVLDQMTGKYVLVANDGQPASYEKEEALESMQRYFYLGHAAILLERPQLDIKVVLRQS